MQNLPNRKSKISFLKGLIGGHRNIDELRDMKLKIWVNYNDPKYFCDGVHVTQQEFAEMVANIPFGKLNSMFQFNEQYK
jgi:hypothetical protein